MITSSRTDLLKRTKTLAEKRVATHEGESTLVKRGPINWMLHDWTSNPRGLAIMMDDSGMWPEKHGFRDGNMTFEYFASMPDQTGIPQVDDDLSGEMIDDLVWIISTLVKEKNARGEPIVTRIDRPNTRIVESHDVNLRAQGIIVTLNLNF